LRWHRHHDKTDAEWKRRLSCFRPSDQAKGIEDLKATVTAARKLPGANGKVGTMGYCWAVASPS